MSKNAAGIEVFQGFNIKYPEYSVITPHTLLEFTIRSMTVAEEEKLKGSLLTTNKLAEHLNNVIFECLAKKPDSIKSYQDFIGKLSIKDRDALMYGLYHVTYKDIQAYDVSCGECNHLNSVKVDFLKGFKCSMWEDPATPALDKEVKVKLDIASNVTVVVKQPKLSDEEKLLKSMAFSSEATRDMAMQLLMINRFEVDRPEAKTPDTIVERENILKGYNQLPSTDRKLIEKAYADNFGKYGVDVQSIVICQKCGFENKITIDLVRQFFRSMYE